MTTDQQELSDREVEILRLVATGASNKEIAQKLYISTNTVKVHLRNIFAKISVASRTEAAMYAVSNRLVPELVPEAAETNAQGELQPAVKTGIFQRFRTNPYLFWGLFAALGIIVAGLFAYWFVQRSKPQAQVSPAFQPPGWQELSPMLTPRSGLAVASLDGYIYAIGGENQAGVSEVVERYDIERDRWKRLQSKPTPVADIQAAVIGGNIYIPGGRLQGGEITDVMEVYYPPEGRWGEAASLPRPISAYALVAFEGKIYLFGGFDGNSYLDTVYAYDPDLNLWQRMSDMPSPRAYASAVVSDGRIHLIGGFDGSTALAEYETYSPNKEKSGESPWEVMLPLPTARYRLSAVSVADVIYILGGVGEGTENREALYYLPQQETWQTIPNPVDGVLEGLGALAVGTKIYALGGNHAETDLNGLYEYQVIYITVLPIVP